MNENLKNVKISGIRKFYNEVQKVEGAISLTLGQPDFKLPVSIEEGLINAILNTNIDWLQSSSAPVFIIILMVWKNLGYNVLLIISSLLSMPKEYEEAASLDGGGDVCIAYHIKIPYIIPTLFFVVVISLFNCFKIFREVFLLQGEYPSDSLYMLQHFMNNNFLKLNYQRLATAAFILYSVIFVIIYVMCYFQEKYIKSLEARG